MAAINNDVVAKPEYYVNDNTIFPYTVYGSYSSYEYLINARMVS